MIWVLLAVHLYPQQSSLSSSKLGSLCCVPSGVINGSLSQQIMTASLENSSSTQPLSAQGVPPRL